MEKLLKRTCFHGTGLGAVQSMELGWVLCRGCWGKKKNKKQVKALSHSWKAPGAAATEPAHSPSSCLCWSPGDGMQWASLVIAKYHLIPEVRAGWSIHRHPWSRSGAGAAEVRVELYESNWTGPCPHVLHLTLFCRKTLASRVPPSFKK